MWIATPSAYSRLIAPESNLFHQRIWSKLADSILLSDMDYIRSFDIRLEKDVYYAGEILSGHIVLENCENIKIRGDCQLLLKISTLSQLQIYIDFRNPGGSERKSSR